MCRLAMTFWLGRRNGVFDSHFVFSKVQSSNSAYLTIIDRHS